MNEQSGEKTINSNHDLIAGAQWAIQTVQWLIKSVITLCLSLIFAFGLLNIVQGAFRVFAYYWLSNEAHRYPLDLAPLFLGFKCTAFFLVTIWLLSQYRASAACGAIVKRSIRIGLVLGVLLTGIVAVERFVINYYTNQISCEYPEPPQNPR
ncbi:hypothetical protein [Polynucleobacter sp. AM-7D1]|uniref:hypothetical protein n=1 Tax=Polynucleobacter sp. AM-7D1 TaxID=2689102 RepID=UPI001BFE4C33|nr:hypothetical protein [Polynucleobacter sp. AM-7D1]QWE27939.1 hypothetical protein GQ359_05830 [Polynucleobacter sp. AM-7D1]